jgi:hypothetical protein
MIRERRERNEIRETIDGVSVYRRERDSEKLWSISMLYLNKREKSECTGRRGLTSEEIPHPSTHTDIVGKVNVVKIILFITINDEAHCYLMLMINDE